MYSLTGWQVVVGGCLLLLGVISCTVLHQEFPCGSFVCWQIASVSSRFHKRYDLSANSCQQFAKQLPNYEECESHQKQRMFKVKVMPFETCWFQW